MHCVLKQNNCLKTWHKTRFSWDTFALNQSMVEYSASTNLKRYSFGTSPIDSSQNGWRDIEKFSNSSTRYILYHGTSILNRLTWETLLYYYQSSMGKLQNLCLESVNIPSCLYIPEIFSLFRSQFIRFAHHDKPLLVKL